MLTIDFKDAQICINCGHIHHVAIEEVYGKGVCPQCGEKMCVTMKAYIDSIANPEDFDCTVELTAEGMKALEVKG
ncbi:MAG: hypothetical protein HZB61_10155 [Nitrospirae bacterium]|nr:hypothetical protein [Nitrospirota bacterium]